MDDSGLELKTFAPHPLLAPFVQSYWVMESPASSEIRYLHPDGGHGISLNFGDPVSGDQASLPQGISVGVRLLAPRALRLQGRVRLAGIRLQPEGAFPLFRTSELTADSFRGGELAELFDRAGRVASPRGLTALFDSWLLRRGRTGETVPVVAEAVRRIRRARGTVRIESVARELALTPRHLERLFKERVGYSPKQLARITRARAAKNALAAGSGPLALLAARFGYADQAHFTREFSQIIGIPPADYLQRRAGVHQRKQGAEGACAMQQEGSTSR